MPVRMLAQVSGAKAADTYTGTDEDTFDRDESQELGEGWVVAPWLLKGLRVHHNTAYTTGSSIIGNVRRALQLSGAHPYRLQADVVAIGGRRIKQHKYLWARLDDVAPDATQDGVEVRLLVQKSGATYAYSGTLTVRAAGVDVATHTLLSGTFTPPLPLALEVDGNSVRVLFGDVEILSSTGVVPQSGKRLGIGDRRQGDDPASWDNFLVTGVKVAGEPTQRRTKLVAGKGGRIHYEATPGVLIERTGALGSISDDHSVLAAEQEQKLFIAEYGAARVTGTDGTIGGVNHDTLTAPGVADWTALGIDRDNDVVIISGADPVTGPVNGTYEIASVAAGVLYIVGNLVRDGACSYRVEKAPKVYDPGDDSVALWLAEVGKGAVPSGCRCIALWRNRLVLASTETDPHNWFMSRQGDPLDWDYGQTDAQAAVAGNAANAGMLGAPITALVPWTDDYLLIGCANSLWLMRGDPLAGGVIDNVSYKVGIVDKKAWTHDPAGIVYFLAHDGLYRLVPNGRPESLSGGKLPESFRGLNLDVTEPWLVYDTEHKGVFVFLTNRAEQESRHWFYDLRHEAFWPDAYPTRIGPTAAHFYEADAEAYRRLLLGGRNDAIYVFDDLAKDDDGDIIDSYVLTAPVRVADADDREGIVTRLQAAVPLRSDRIDWELRLAKTHEEAITASARSSGVWKGGGLMRPSHARARGGSMCLRLRNARAHEGWAIERVTARVLLGGKARV